MLWRPLLSSATSVEPVPLVMACALCCGALLAFCAIGLRIGLQANSIGTLLAAVLVTHIAVVAASSTGERKPGVQLTWGMMGEARQCHIPTHQQTLLPAQSQAEHMVASNSMPCPVLATV